MALHLAQIRLCEEDFNGPLDIHVDQLVNKSCVEFVQTRTKFVSREVQESLAFVSTSSPSSNGTSKLKTVAFRGKKGVERNADDDMIHETVFVRPKTEH